MSFFFFQAEDGIRDLIVTGVQTCALPICTLREQIAGVFRQQRLIARLTSFFGVLSLILASIGLYGATAYNAGRRVNEIGVRMALGADRRQVVALILQGAFV